MPQPVIPVPPFPNVPNAPGVPPLLRAAGVGNTIAGTITGVRDAATGGFTAAVRGVVLLSTGQAGALVGTLRGVLDGAMNFSAALSGGISGQVIGVMAGTIGAAGDLAGTITGAVERLTGDLSALGADSAGVSAQADPFQWGIFDADGNAVVVGDSVEAFEEAKEYRVADYPLEEGAFESYNKVETPQEIRLTFKKSGTVAERAAFLTSLDTALKSLDIYSVATPEATYPSVNLVHRDMRRTAEKGAQLLTVDVGVRQVRTTAQTAFTNSKDPAGAATVNDGPVQPAPPHAALRAVDPPTEFSPPAGV